MASIEVSKLPAKEHDELCCVYACLVLHDAGIEVTVRTMPHSLGRKSRQAHQSQRQHRRAILPHGLR